MSKERIEQQLAEIDRVKTQVCKTVWDNAVCAKEIGSGQEINKQAIKQRTQAMADTIATRYANDRPVLLTVLDGGKPFANRIEKALAARQYGFTPANIQVNRYKNAQTPGALEITHKPKPPLAGRKVIVLDDVLETGGTFFGIRDYLMSLGARSVTLVVLVDKVQDRKDNYEADLVGFKVPSDAFLVGVGLDYYRELRYEEEVRAVNRQFEPTPEQKQLLDSEEELNEAYIKLINMEKTAKPGSSPITLFGDQSSMLQAPLNAPAPQPPVPM